jgi:hypothetical protein
VRVRRCERRLGDDATRVRLIASFDSAPTPWRIYALEVRRRILRDSGAGRPQPWLFGQLWPLGSRPDSRGSSTPAYELPATSANRTLLRGDPSGSGSTLSTLTSWIRRTSTVLNLPSFFLIVSPIVSIARWADFSSSASFCFCFFRESKTLITGIE